MDRSAIKNMNPDYFGSRGVMSVDETGIKPLVVVVQRLDPLCMDGLTPRQRSEKMSLLARSAARESALLSGLGDISMFHKDDKGAPLPERGIWWGVSHKPEVVAGAVHLSPVGLDVEVIRTVSDRLIERITTEKERKLFSKVDNVSFFRIWSAKEAVLKACGHGLSGLSSCIIDSVIGDSCFAVVYRGEKIPVTSIVRETNVVSVCSLPENVSFVYKSLCGGALLL